MINNVLIKSREQVVKYINQHSFVKKNVLEANHILVTVVEPLLFVLWADGGLLQNSMLSHPADNNSHSNIHDRTPEPCFNGCTAL